MSSYFKDRFNRLRIGETTSSWKCVKRGCPHGSSFGPLLWNLFQNDLNFVCDLTFVCLLTIIKFMKSIKTLVAFKLNHRPVLKKQLVGMSQIHLRALYGKYGSMFISRVNKLKDYKLRLNVNGTDIKACLLYTSDAADE